MPQQMDTGNADEPNLVNIMQLDMKLHGSRLIRVELACVTLLATFLTLVVLVVGLTRWPPVWSGRLLILALGCFFAGWLVNCLTLLIIACRHTPAPGVPNDPAVMRRATLHISGLILLPLGIPVTVFRQSRHHRRPSSLSSTGKRQ